ncbi:hypothetical protein ZIOFF_071306 [Zingiber officinale]|uniref:Piwi domain-containing protein n=1 Tax=Zingiber officinale TaxID=94328 RepID=A0A8J5C1A3_ZINOF|nr:hypothetical protein ZIOFF_071306 [Zingiber officinale]
MKLLSEARLELQYLIQQLVPARGSLLWWKETTWAAVTNPRAQTCEEEGLAERWSGLSSSSSYSAGTPTIILGMDVSHGSLGHSNILSIIAVVSSRQWPSICRYRAFVQTQSPKIEMIGKRKLENIIIFRDGVSESQFIQVLIIELDQIIEACKFLDEQWNYDFYMCAHANMIGTTRPTHYHVLMDEIGFIANSQQKLIHSLSYV